MADDIRPITLQEEENKRINIKKQIQNISNQYEEIYGNILGEKQVDVTTTMDEDLESAFKPFVDSNKYNQKELKIIKDHLLNTLKMKGLVEVWVKKLIHHNSKNNHQ